MAHVRFDPSSGEHFDDWIDRVAANRFNRRWVYEHGNWTALFDAVMDLHDETDPGAETVSVPGWIVSAIAEDVLPLGTWSIGRSHRQPVTVAAVLRRRAAEPNQRLGRPLSSWSLKTWRRDLVDWNRYHEVWYRHLAGASLGLTRSEARDERVAYHLLRDTQRSQYRVHTGVPYQWSENSSRGDMSAFRAASVTFGESPEYRGSPDEMRKSVERVRLALDRGECWRYYPTKWIQLGAMVNQAGADRAR